MWNRKISQNVPLKVLLAIYIAGLCLVWGFFIWSFAEGVLLFESPHDRILPLLVLCLFVSSFAMLFLVATIGIWFYVYHDAGRRGMNQLLWVLIAIFTPNLLGIILYLVLRKPLMAECPACSSLFEPQLLFCPHCGHQVKRKCAVCNSVAEPAYQFCSTCGAKLSGTGQ
jgi:hypothetical protein